MEVVSDDGGGEVSAFASDPGSSSAEDSDYVKEEVGWGDDRSDGEEEEGDEGFDPQTYEKKEMPTSHSRCRASYKLDNIDALVR